MDLKNIFRGISGQLQSSFNGAANFKHNGVKGTFREKALSEFLSSGRLPGRFGIGSGEIVGPTHETSRQSDLIIYDKLDGIPLLYSDELQIFPIESIYGLIEVKSGLSKEDFIDALNNIKSMKQIVPDDIVSISPYPFMQHTQPRSIPFGIIFAYKLAGNSLSSLTKNLIEWEKEVPHRYDLPPKFRTTHAAYFSSYSLGLM